MMTGIMAAIAGVFAGKFFDRNKNRLENLEKEFETMKQIIDELKTNVCLYISCENRKKLE